jgi:hypothetical protein
MTMTSEVRQFYVDWVAKLRSGTIEQGFGKLHQVNDKMCCIGVACVVAGIEPTRDRDTDWFYRYEGNSINLPESLQVKINLSAGQQKKLVDMNDSTGFNFEQIADYIEQNFIGKSTTNVA